MIARMLPVVLMLCQPSLARPTTFWDDEMESGDSGYKLAAGMSYDTTVKFSGSASVKLHYGPECEPHTFGGPGCGGFMDRNFLPTDDLYRRFYIRLSPGFQTSITTCTELMRSDTKGVNSNWWLIGQGNGKIGGRTLMVGDQNVPTVGQTITVYTSFNFPQEAKWYCIETHEKLNTPGVADGVQEAWVDGVQVLNRRDIQYRQTGDKSLFVNNRMYRQTGVGDIWYDRVAVGNTRIGPVDTSKPAATKTKEKP